MLPYFDEPQLTIGRFTLRAFAVLVAVGIAVGYAVVLRRARRRGLNRDWAAEMCVAMIVCGFVGAHLVKILVYDPHMFRRNPMAVFAVFQGMASFGGILGGLGTGWLYLRWRRIAPADQWRYFDVIAFAFPFAWVFGRLGCALAHDHVGIRGSGWLAIDYPTGARYNLGLIEALYAGLIGVLFVFLDRRERRAGFYVATFLLLYGPFRFAQDYLHVEATHYFGLATDQIGGIVATGIGLACLGAMRRRKIE